MKTKTFFIIATPIGNLSDISTRAKESINKSNLIICENKTNTKKLFKLLDIDFTNKNFISYNKYDEDNSQKHDYILNKINDYENAALLSDAGTPLISDPGFLLIEKIIKDNKFKIESIPGASSIIVALTKSSLINNKFKFNSFLPKKENEIKKELEKIKNDSFINIYFLSKYNIDKFLKLAKELINKDRKIVLAKELTKINETFYYFYSDNIPQINNKGEFVLLIDGINKNKEEKNISINETIEQIDELIKNKKLKIKEATKILENKYNISSNKIYDNYVKNKK